MIKKNKKESERIQMEPIGRVKSKFRKPEELHIACKKGRLFNAQSEIILASRNKKMLAGLEEFSHVWVIFHLHKADKVEAVTYPGPSRISGLPPVGVLASRSQYRPNHIALRLVQIIEVRGNSLKIMGLDAIDDSPVLDIKPYVPHFDMPASPKTAYWYEGWSDD